MKTNLLGTFVGSFPHDEAIACVREIFQATPDAPSWPQLPRRSVSEHFLVQWGFVLPGVRFDAEHGKWIVPDMTQAADVLPDFYEKVFAAEAGETPAFFACRPDVQPGFFLLNDALVSAPTKPSFAKVQVIGPVSFGLGLEDEDGSRAFFREDYRDVLVKALSWQARWQVRTLTPLTGKVICFIDEPYLQSYGSSDLIAIKRDDVLETLGEVIRAVQAEGGIAGVHVCGNTEWPLIIDAGANLLNFDAYLHGESLLLYPRELSAYLARGGIVAWGVVPTNPEAIDRESGESLAARMEGLFERAKDIGIDVPLLVSQSMITPACGLGTLDVDHARKAMYLVAETSAILRKRYALA